MNNKRVLVIGGTSFVGSYLLRYLLQAGYSVRATKAPNSPMGLVKTIQNQVEWHEGNILHPAFVETALQDVQQVYHTATLFSIAPHEAAQMMKFNQEGTAHIVNSALEEKIEKLVYISSTAAIGRKEFQPHIDERIQWENSKKNSNYAISMFRAECEVWRAKEEGLSTAIINPSTIIGAGYWADTSCLLLQKAIHGLPYYPLGSTGFVDVRDVARAAIALMESDIEGERYIVNGENRSFKNILSIVAKLLNQKPPQWAAQTQLLKVLSRLNWFNSKFLRKKTYLTDEVINFLQEAYYYDNNKIKADLQFEFTPLDDCLYDTIQTYQKSQTNHSDYGVLELN